MPDHFTTVNPEGTDENTLVFGCREACTMRSVHFLGIPLGQPIPNFVRMFEHIAVGSRLKVSPWYHF